MDLEKTIDTLRKALLRDKEYFYAWQSNIAMSFFDEAKRQKVKVSVAKLHEISNNAAVNFLKLLCK